MYGCTLRARGPVLRGMAVHSRAARLAVLELTHAPRAFADEAAPAPLRSGAPAVTVRAAEGIGGVGLHPLGGRVDRLGASASGVFLEGLVGVPLGPFVVAGSVDAFAATQSRTRSRDDDVRPVDRALIAFTAGPALVWCPWGGPAGLSVGLGPRACWVPAQPAWSDVARLPALIGAGALAQLGHGWSLQGKGTVGVLARVAWGTTLRDDSGVSAYQFVQLTLGASVTFP